MLLATESPEDDRITGVPEIRVVGMPTLEAGDSACGEDLSHDAILALA